MTWLLNCRALSGGGPVRAADVLTNPPDQLGVARLS